MAPVFSQELLHQLTSYPFPGNIRELKHLVEATLTLADPAKTLEFDHLPASIRRQLRSRSLPSGDQADTGRSLKEQTFYDFERRRIREALDRSGGRIIEASRSLGISRVTLWRKMKKLALLPDVSS